MRAGTVKQVYGWVEQVLFQHEYAQQGKAARGLVRRYIEKMTGLSRAQVTRLIARYTATGRVRATVYRRRRFPRSLHAGRHRVAGLGRRGARDPERARRRGAFWSASSSFTASRSTSGWRPISVAHLYNLRHSQRYRERRLNYVKTRPTAVSIGERRKPDPQGQPGYLRLDTVHQGDAARSQGRLSYQRRR